MATGLHASLVSLDFAGAQAYLASLADAERSLSVGIASATYDLARFRTLLHALGNPEQAVPAIHIAGTKGKGSVAAMTESALRAAGYKTGLFTSPHLLEVRERIRLHGKCVSPAGFASAATDVRRAALAEELEITAFEALTAMAFLLFIQAHLDVQVVEVGLGGLLDTTNVITPLVSAITPVSLDHAHILGSSIAEIAGQKAGILKPGVPAVIARQPAEARAVLEARAVQVGAPLLLSDLDFGWEPRGRPSRWSANAAAPPPQRIRYWAGFSGGADIELRVPLLGEHQFENAAVATAVCQSIGVRGFTQTPAQIRRGIASVHWPGRLQVLRKQPLVVVDGAHNPASARALRAALQRHFDFRKLILVFGAAADKDILAMADILRPLASQVILTRANSERAATPERLAAHFPGALLSPDIAGAYRMALAAAAPDDLICATGSLYVVGEVLQAAGCSTVC